MTGLRTGFYAVATALFALAAMNAQAEDGPVPVTAAPLALSDTDATVETIGRLAYRGGLVLSSSEERVGGVSGLRWLGGDRFLAITDQGDWLRLDTEEADGRLSGIAAARIGILTDDRGAPLLVKPLADAEALTIQRKDGEPAAANVYFERSHRAWRYALDEDGGIGAFVREVPLGDWTEALPENGGIEAVAGTDRGTFLIPEDLRRDGRVLAHRQWRGGDGKLRTSEIPFELPADFKPTDAHALPDGGILLLSRRYSPLQGVAARLDLLEFQASPSGPGRLKRTPLTMLKAPLTVDNMEALAIRVSGERTFLYLMSDDNFSPVQRTLLMKFELMPAKRAAQARPSAKPPEAKPGPGETISPDD